MRRLVVTYIVVGEPNVDAAEECPTCGFDAVLAFPLTSMNESGVGPFGTYKACMRCHDERGSL